MRLLQFTGIAVIAAFCVTLPADEPPTKAELPSPDEPAIPESNGAETAVIESPLDLELRVSGNNAVLAAERNLSKGVTEAGSLKRKAKQATRPVRVIQQEITNLKVKMLQSEQQLVGLNAQLANVQDVGTNNRLVGAINTIEGQISLARKTLESLRESETKARVELNNAREGYVEHVLSLRRMADQLSAAYASGADSPEIAQKLTELIAESGKELKFEPSTSFGSSRRKLDEYEKSIHTEKIPLRSDNNTFYASVVINGKHTAEMIVDSGASVISLPYDLAVTMGLEPKPGDKQILLSLADGSTITGHLKTIDSVRVGTFTVQKVDCAVLGPEAVNAVPLLGMSFLGEFQFQLDSAESTLGITEIEADSRRQ